MRYINLLCFLFIICLSCSKVPRKINGVSFVASSDSISAKHVQPIVKINANYAALMPFAVLQTVNTSTIYYNEKRQWFGETKAGLKQYAKWLKESDIKLMVKPQIWVRNGAFTGDIIMKTEADWLNLEKTYSNFILDYAKAAQSLNAEVFCIGTELEFFVRERPMYWNELILKIRAIYKGKLTYAANWNEFTKTPFWDRLDFIGIDAYFPVSKLQNPTYEDCIKGWKPYKSLIKNYSDKHNKPILFTEFGYRSVDFTANEPWRYDNELRTINFDAQNNATRALFDTFWNESWFAGGFIWKWFINHETSGGKNNNRFTPQNKPLESILKAHYEAY